MSVTDWLNQTITIQRYTGTDGFGDPSYSAAETLSCRISYKHRRVLNAAGEDVTSTAYVTLGETATIRDKFTLTTTRIPIAVKNVYDGAGFFHHCGVYL